MSRNEKREQINVAIAKLGASEVKSQVFEPFMHQMVSNHRFVERFKCPLLAVGFGPLDPEGLEMYIDGLLELTADPTEKAKIQEIYDYWKAHRTEILVLHDVSV